MQESLKRSLALAVGVVASRLFLEAAGAPSWVNTVFGVTWLYLLVPIYFAKQIAKTFAERPYVELAKACSLFVLLAAAMVGTTYSLAYKFHFPAYRFSVEGGGVVGDGVSPIQGFLLSPLSSFGLSAAIGLVAAIVIGPLALRLLRQAPVSVA